MRYIPFVGLIILLSWGLFILFPGQQASEENNSYRALYRIMEMAGARIVKGEIHYWAEISPCSNPCSARELEEKADDIFQLISGELGTSRMEGVEAGESFSENHENGASTYRVERETNIAPGFQLQMALQRMEQDGNNPLHLLVVIRETGEAGQLEKKVNKLLSTLDSRTMKSSLSVSLTGHVNEKMDLFEMETLADTAARESGGQQVRSVKDESMVSITGYLPELGEYLQAENMRINLNLALRYDNNVEKTVIRAGTPLIAGWH